MFPQRVTSKRLSHNQRTQQNGQHILSEDGGREGMELLRQGAEELVLLMFVFEDEVSKEVYQVAGQVTTEYKELKNYQQEGS